MYVCYVCMLCMYVCMYAIYVCMYASMYHDKDILKQSPRKACVCYEMIGSTASQERVKSA